MNVGTLPATVVVLPMPFVLSVLGELCGHDPDMMASFLKAIPPPDGKSYSRSMRNLTMTLEPEFYGAMMALVVNAKDEKGLILDVPSDPDVEYCVGLLLDDEFLDSCSPKFKKELDTVPAHNPPPLFNPKGEDGDEVWYARCIYFDPLVLYRINEDEEEPDATTMLANCFWECASMMVEEWNPDICEEH